MRIVLLSGGSGKRLWPLSNEIRSKVFLKLLPSGSGSKESMIQRVCRQLDEAGLLQNTMIVTHSSQLEITQNHVGERIPIVTETYKRGTYTAVALAASYFHSELHVDRNETICVLPVDLFVKPAFFAKLRTFPDVLEQSKASLALLGTTPTFPSNQFGYIVPGLGEAAGYSAVAEFVEKPSVQQAARLIEQKALWNCGVFAFPLRFMLDYLEKQGLPTSYEQLLGRYEHLPDLSFDHEIVEKTSKRAVIVYEQTWHDLGSWSSLTEQLESRVIGSGFVSDDSINTHLVNEQSYPIYVLDVPNIIVAASVDGILVASKKNANQIKERLGGVPQHPKYEEKSWGSYRVLDYSKTSETMEVLIRKIELLAGKSIGYHQHANRNEMWTITLGTGEVRLDGHCYQVQPGDVIQMPRGMKHSVKAHGVLELIELQIGASLLQKDCIDTSNEPDTEPEGT